jgi:hypothetical protein
MIWNTIVLFIGVYIGQEFHNLPNIKTVFSNKDNLEYFINMLQYAVDYIKKK